MAKLTAKSKLVQTTELLFQHTRHRLLALNLIVFALVLTGFTVAIRLAFIHNLRQQFTQQLTTLAQQAVAEMDLEDDRVEVDTEDLLRQEILTPQQTIQWFTPEGRSVATLGNSLPTAILNPKATVTYEKSSRLQLITLPIRASGESDAQLKGQLIGYVRVSQPLTTLDHTITQLDWGLGSGMVVALLLSSLGAVWLNRQAMRPIKTSFQRLQQFTADASHELRSPLMAISSNAEVALKYADGMRRDDRETFAMILSAAAQMTCLTEDLLLLARTDQAIHTTKTPINLSSLLTNLVRLYQPQAIEKEISFTSTIQPNLTLMGDAPTLTRAFTNLIQNALSYTPAQGIVTLKGEKAGDQLQIQLTDTGIGIAPEHLDKIFERFWQADPARTQATGGCGLGLSIVEAIVRDHGGTLQVESQVGQGSCFTVYLPLLSSS